jgi:hypothetical protein
MEDVIASGAEAPRSNLPLNGVSSSRRISHLRGDCFVGLSMLSHLNPPRNDILFLILDTPNHGFYITWLVHAIKTPGGFTKPPGVLYIHDVRFNALCFISYGDSRPGPSNGQRK